MRKVHPLALLLATALLVPAPGQSVWAQAPACKPESAGTVVCMAGRLCDCAPRRGGRMTGEPEGWRWDCGILRPACGGGPDTPAMTGDYPVSLPWSLSLEGSDLVPRRRPDHGPSRPRGGPGR